MFGYVAYSLLTITLIVLAANFLNGPTEVKEAVNQENMVYVTPTPTLTPIPSPQAARVKFIDCDVMGDVVKLKSESECKYWQNYWSNKYLESQQVPVQVGNYNLNLQPIELKKTEVKSIVPEYITPDIRMPTIDPEMYKPAPGIPTQTPLCSHQASGKLIPCDQL